MKRSCVMFLVVALGLAFAAAPVSATVVFYDNFESDSGAGSPVIGVGDIGGSWVDPYADSWTYAGADDGTGNKYYYGNRRTGTDWQTGSEIANPISGISSDIALVEFDYTAPGVTNSHVAYIYSGEGMITQLLFQGNGVDPGTGNPTTGDVLYYAPGDAFVDTGLDYTAIRGQFYGWSNVSVACDIAAGTFDLTVNGNSVSGLPAYSGPGTDVAKVWFFGNISSNEAWGYDNVTISQVPEPSALLGLGMIGLTLLFYRRK